MKAIAKHLDRLEERLGAEGKPRKTFRIMTRPQGRALDLENSSCQRLHTTEANTGALNDCCRLPPQGA